MDRREFLKTSGALVVSFAAPSFEALAQAPGKPPLVPNELDSWIAILPDGRVNAFFGKMDMGQGLDVAVAQVVAEELDVGADKVTVFLGDTATSCNQGGASGSTGVSNGARLLRKAAAEARRILIERAADKLGAPAAELRVEDGTVIAPRGKTTYAELVGGRYFHHQVQWNKQTGNPMDISVPAKPKPPAEYKVVGKPLARRDVAGKVYGASDFVTDVRVPGMLHARVIRPPRAACSVRGIDESSIKGIRGARVVHEKDFVAVVAPREWDAVRAARELKVDWHYDANAFPTMDALYEHIRAAEVVKREEPVNQGDVEAALKTPGARVIEAQYEWPFQSHASMGPACALADVNADGCTVWTGSQKPHYTREGVAKLLGMPAEKVRAMWVPGPGSYGRNDAGDAAIDAAYLSRAVGNPVRVQYMRAEGTGWDPKAPASVHRARAALDASGKVLAYDFLSKAFSRQHIATNESNPADSLLGQALGLTPKGNPVFGTPAESYGFENKRLAWETIPPLVQGCSPLRTSHMRDPAGPNIHFASEQFIDELAHATGEDPVAFRLRYLTNPRHAAVLKAAAEKAGWSSLGKGKGIAFADRNGTAVAVVAEVEVDRASGRVWARRFTVAHDCGLIVNPLLLRQTIEGNVVQGLSRTLFEEVRFQPDSIASLDWASYPILEMPDAPERIEIVLIDRPEVAPSGAGEPALRVIAAAVANAFFSATGVRLRRAPLSPERVKAALSRS